MMRPVADLALSPLLALAVVLAVIGVALYLARALGRRSRRQARRARGALARRVRFFLDGRLSDRLLLRLTDRADAGTCWTVLEAGSLRLGRKEWLRLSAALERCRHAVDERWALESDSPWRQELAARRLGLLRSRRSWRALRQAMGRGPELVTIATGLALARYRDRGALRWLLAHPAALARRHRSALADLFAAFRAPGLPVLAEALARGGLPRRVELAAVDALGRGGHAPARGLLEQRLAEADLDLRVAAARALGLTGDPAAAPALVSALADAEWPVRAQSARALGRLGAIVAVPPLAQALTDASWWVRRHAAYALMALGEDGPAALRRIAASSSDAYARDMAREVLDGGYGRLSA